MPHESLNTSRVNIDNDLIAIKIKLRKKESFTKTYTWKSTWDNLVIFRKLYRKLIPYTEFKKKTTVKNLWNSDEEYIKENL